MIHHVDEVLLQGWIAEEIDLSNDCADLAAAHIHRKLAAIYAARLHELRAPLPDRAMATPLPIPN